MYTRCDWLRRMIACILCAGLLAAALPAPVLADTLRAAPLSSGQSRNGMVRISLSSLGTPSALKLTVYGSYTVNGQSSMQLESGASMTVNFSSATGRLTLTAGGVTRDMGSAFKLRRHVSDGQSGIKVAQGRVPGNLYPGDFSFVVRPASSGGYRLYTIAYIYIEDYLYGVLPYEMGNSSGPEALKAQAVAARTYTLRAMNASASGLYDVVDTTSDQVYNGTPSGNANCKAAVDATRGIVATNNGALTATYYTASNGGQTESIKNAWGSNSYSYLTVKDDPYDLANPNSRVKSFSVSASGTPGGTIGTLLSSKAAKAFGSGAIITGISDVQAHTPKYAAPSRLYTKLSFTVSYTLNGQSNTGTLTFDIFSELESQLGMSINSMKNELWSVSRTAGGFTVSVRRYGHGLGMSQRGAMQMASQGHTYDQILGFYYEGCTRTQYTFTRSILSAVVDGQESGEQITTELPADLSPSPSATPSYAGPQARVTTQSGSLNLRAATSDAARVLTTIPQYAVIPILDRGDVWCRTSYNGQAGYVMTKFLTFLSGGEPTPIPTPSAPAPTSAPAESGLYARVTTVKGSLNLRALPEGSAQILRTIPQYETIQVLQRGSGWCQVTYGGYTGYVMSSFLTFFSNPVTAAPAATEPPSALPTPTPAPTAVINPGAGQTAWVNTVQGSLNLRQLPRDTARVLCAIPQNAAVTVHQRGTIWCRVTYNGYTGYVMTDYLRFTGGEQTPTPATAVPATPIPVTQPPVTQAPAPAPQPGASHTTALVATQQGSLNLREYPSGSARVLRTIPQYATVTVYLQGSEWCQVGYAGQTGYVMRKFLSFAGESIGGNSGSSAGAPPTARPTAQPTASAIDYNAQLDPTLRELKTQVSGLVNPDSGTRVNLRVGCSTDAGIVTWIRKGEHVIITAVGEEWCAVQYEGMKGYCMRKYLEFELYE